MPVMHRAWDGSIIRQLEQVDPSIPVYFGQDTTKTMCGKRVSTWRIDNTHTTCVDCVQAASQLILDNTKQLESFGRFFLWREEKFQLLPEPLREKIRPYVELARLPLRA